MDFMKVFDQTVREIKREVNLKVLKVPEIEQKVLDATDDEPWGPTGTVLQEIAQATKKFSECQMVMNVLWARLGETSRNWRHVYKSLTAIEYLVGNGSERAVDDIIEHTFQISALSSFEYVEPSGKDNGINVRKKVETIIALLNDKDKIQEVRNKAAANRDKYFGLSSTGITYKSGSATFGSSSLSSGGGIGSTKDGDSFRSSYKERDNFGDDNTKFDQTTTKSRRGDQETTSKKKSSRHSSKNQDTTTAGASKAVSKTSNSPDNYASLPAQKSTQPSTDYDDEFDDFDPRGNSAAKPNQKQQVDLFGDSLVGDLLDMPTSAEVSSGPTQTSNIDTNSDVDLFADASFVSAPPDVQSGISQDNVDLFASKPPPPSSEISSTIDLFSASDSIPHPVAKPVESQPSAASLVDPFAAVPLNNFDGSDLFGGFTSNTDSKPKEPAQLKPPDDDFSSLNGKSAVESKVAAAKKDNFQVKSGIWADSLSRGLIDLNITAPKKVNLAEVGIVGGLSEMVDERESKGPAASFHMGRAMGAGSGLGRTTSSMASEDFFSSLSSGQQYQYGAFQK
jgi:epsin